MRLNRKACYAWLSEQHSSVTAYDLAARFENTVCCAGQMLRDLEKIGAARNTSPTRRSLWVAVRGVEVPDGRGLHPNSHQKPVPRAAREIPTLCQVWR